MILGFYDHDKEFDDEESKSEDPPLPRLRHHTQIYLNGSTCDLTGGFRHTEVRVSKIFGCPLGIIIIRTKNKIN